MNERIQTWASTVNLAGEKTSTKRVYHHCSDCAFIGIYWKCLVLIGHICVRQSLCVRSVQSREAVTLTVRLIAAGGVFHTDWCLKRAAHNLSGRVQAEGEQETRETATARTADGRNRDVSQVCATPQSPVLSGDWRRLQCRSSEEAIQRTAFSIDKQRTCVNRRMLTGAGGAEWALPAAQK